MEIVSWQFALLTAAVLGVYYLLPHRVQNTWLLLASYGYYATWGLAYALILAATTLTNYILGIFIETQPTRRRLWMWLGLAANLAGLVIFRLAGSSYASWLHPLLPASLQADPQSALARFFLPVGFSFYTLQAISYLVDVSRRQVKAARNLVNFGLYMAYFLKLTAGPIERWKAFGPRLVQPRRVENQDLGRGAARIAEGLVRKLVIADTLTRLLPVGLFTEPGTYGGAQLWTGIFMYAFILYNDFAGYTAIVRGLSAWFGIELTPNFQQPYFARGFVEFWNRWHLSLSYWLRDYIFFPLSRWLARRFPDGRHPLNLALPPLVTFAASGLWHGFSLGMATWGILHGLFQWGERLVSIGRPRAPAHELPAWRQVGAGLFTFLLVTLAWVPFATNDLSLALVYWRGLFLFPVGAGFDFTPAWTVFLVGLSLVIDWVQYHNRDETVALHWPIPAQAFLLALTGLLVLSSLGRGMDVSGFVYQGF